MTNATKQYLRDFINANREKEWFLLEVDFLLIQILPEEFWGFMENVSKVFRNLDFEIRRWTKQGSEKPQELYLFKRRGTPLPTDYLSGKVVFEA